MSEKKKILIALIGIATVLMISVRPASASLNEEIKDIFNRYKIQETSISIDVVSLRTGLPIYRFNPTLALNPASTMKLLTTVAALETLGLEHRYPTEFYTRHPAQDGAVSELWVKGYGSPIFVSEEMHLIAKTLIKMGIRQINGPIYVDDSFFGAAEPIRFPGKTGKSVYRVITGALSYNFNHPSSLLAAARSYKKKKTSAQLTQENPKRPALLNQKILDPALYTGIAIKENLERQGIPVTGKVLFKKVPKDATLVLFHTSQRMMDILSGLNKFSNNFIAEQVLLSLGAARFGTGSREKGLAVLKETLEKIGVSHHNHKLHNGSGLSHNNRLSAVQLTTLLRHAISSPYGEALTRALSIAGVDGTLQKRFQGSPLKGKVWAKTGTLYSVSALAGYFLAGDEPLTFAILINGFKTGPDPAERAEQAILEAISRSIEKSTEKT